MNVVYTCSTCSGEKTVKRQDEDGNTVDANCQTCDGTGQIDLAR